MRIPAKYNVTRVVEFSEDNSIDTIVESLLALKYKIITVDKDGGRVVARTRLNMSSWTEKVTVNILQNNKVEIESKCSFPLQIIDWGKNRRNVEKVFSLIG